MNDNNEKKVRRGDRLQIPAATWNNIVDGMKNFKRTKFNKPNAVNDDVLSDLIKSNTTVLVYNASDYDQATSFRIMRLNGTVLDVVADKLEANRRIAFNAFVPTASDNPIAILQCPLEMTEIGKAITSGISVTRVRMLDMAHEWANPVAGSTDYLESATDGQARILWFGLSDDEAEQEAGIYIAIVHLTGVTVGSTSEDLVTNICPIFEDVTYEQAIDELNDLLSRIDGYAVGRVLGLVDPADLAWIDPPEPTISGTTPTTLTGYLKGNGATVSAVDPIPLADLPDAPAYSVLCNPTNAVADRVDLDVATSAGGIIAPAWFVFNPAVSGLIFKNDGNNPGFPYSNGTDVGWLDSSTVGIVTTDGTNVQVTAITFDTDVTLAANSDSRLATQKAVKTYVDTAVVGLWEIKGSTNCSANPNYPAALKGDAYIVTVAGRIGGASGKLVDVGDWYLAIADNAGGTEAAVGASWAVIEHNIAGVILSGDAAGGDLTGTYPNPTVDNNKITDAKFRQSVALSVVGRSANSTGNVADMAAASDGQVLRRSGTTLAFGAVDLANANAVTGVLPEANGGSSSGIQATLSLASTYTFTSAVDTYTTLTGMSVSLAAGTYRISYAANGQQTPATGSGHLLALKLRDTTNSVDLTTPRIPVFSATGTATAIGDCSDDVEIVLAGIVTIALQVARSGGTTWTSSSVRAGATLTYTKTSP